MDVGADKIPRRRIFSMKQRSVALSRLKLQADAEGFLADIPNASTQLSILLNCRVNELRELSNNDSVTISMTIKDIEALQTILKGNRTFGATATATLEAHLDSIVRILKQEHNCESAVAAYEGADDHDDGEQDVDCLVAELLPMCEGKKFKSPEVKDRAKELVVRVQKDWSFLQSVYRKYARMHSTTATALLAEIRPLDVHLIMELIEEADAVAYKIEGKVLLTLTSEVYRSVGTSRWMSYSTMIKRLNS